MHRETEIKIVTHRNMTLASTNGTTAGSSATSNGVHPASLGGNEKNGGVVMDD